MHPYDESFVIWHTREVEARTVSKRHLLLAREVEEARTLACEEGGEHRRRELCLPAREVEDVGTPPKFRKDPPPARFCMRGRWRSGER
jgi:hypothetical protein